MKKKNNIFKNIFKHKKKRINKTTSKKRVNKLEIKKKTGPINKRKKQNNKHLDQIMERRFNFITVIIIILFLVISTRVFYLQILKNNEYNEKLAMSTEKTIESTSAPRGRI